MCEKYKQLDATYTKWILSPPPFRSGCSTAPELEATIRSDWIWSYPTQPRNLERPACLDGCYSRPCKKYNSAAPAWPWSASPRQLSGQYPIKQANP
ncbi:hypothetical protein KY289_007751 [Solanum tuberosum]|nr:hypothetical protein KY289_007751 [Solanum tuberosum]